MNAVSVVVPRRNLRRLPALAAVLFLASFAGTSYPARATGDTARTPGDSAVIRVDGAVVTASEFQERLNLTPSGIQVPDPDARRRLVAASLVAEKLLALQARRLSLDSSSAARTAAAEMEKEAVYEQWMSREITSRVRITPDDLRKALARFRQRRFVKYMVFPDSASALAARRSLRPGAGLDSVRLASKTPPVLAKSIDYAEALPEVEDLVFSLRPGQVGPPLRIEGRFYLFELFNVIRHPQHAGGSFNYWRPALERRVRARQEDRLFKQEVPALLKNKTFTVDRDAFDFVAGELSRRLSFHDSQKLRQPELLNNELSTIPPSLESRLAEPFLKFTDGQVWSIGDVWRNLRFGPYLLNYRSAADFKAGLPDLLRRMVIFETVVADGYGRGMQRTDYVRRESRMWTDNMLARSLQQVVADTIQLGENDLRAWYDKYGEHYKHPELRLIQELVVRDSRLARALVDSLLAGADMNGLIARHALPVGEGSLYPKGFWIAKGAHGEVGTQAFMLKPGGFAGPVPLDSIYLAIVKLLDVRPEAPAPFDSVRERVRSDLLQTRTRAALTRMLEEHAAGSRIDIDFDRISRIDVLEGNLMALKSHFPNRTAVPLLTPFDPSAPWFARATGKP